MKPLISLNGVLSLDTGILFLLETDNMKSLSTFHELSDDDISLDIEPSCKKGLILSIKNEKLPLGNNYLEKFAETRRVSLYCKGRKETDFSLLNEMVFPEHLVRKALVAYDFLRGKNVGLNVA